MLGVVLWSDKQLNRAVIWCEDHRDLAFYRGGEDCAGDATGFDPGDLVQFDVQPHGDMRLAMEPSLVAPEEYTSLVRELQEAQRSDAPPVKLPEAPTRPSEVVPLHPGANDVTAPQKSGTRRLPSLGIRFG